MLSLTRRCLLGRVGVNAAAASRVAPAAFSTKSDAEVLSEWMTGPPRKLDAAAIASAAFETVALSLGDVAPGVLHVKLSRPKTVNAMNMHMWSELGEAFELVERDPSVKAVVLSGDGRGFSSGMDLHVFATMQKLALAESCDGRKREMLMRVIDRFQRVVSAPERCRVPVLAAVHGACIGAGVDLITACDLRYCDASAVFSVKEVDLAIIADVGTLQRLPKLVGEQQAKELAFTGRNFGAVEAAAMGLVLKTFPDQEQLLQHVGEVAAAIATKSPLTVRGIKQTIHYQRDHSTRDALEQVRYHNAAVLYSEDLAAAITGVMSKTPAAFRDD
jgi:enoyl-CoA hydratase